MLKNYVCFLIVSFSLFFNFDKIAYVEPHGNKPCGLLIIRVILNIKRLQKQTKKVRMYYTRHTNLSRRLSKNVNDVKAINKYKRTIIMRVLHVVLNDVIRMYVSDSIDLLQPFYFRCY